jgi:hypothetical protein
MLLFVVSGFSLRAIGESIFLRIRDGRLQLRIGPIAVVAIAQMRPVRCGLSILFLAELLLADAGG